MCEIAQIAGCRLREQHTHPPTPRVQGPPAARNENGAPLPAGKAARGGLRCVRVVCAASLGISTSPLSRGSSSHTPPFLGSLSTLRDQKTKAGMGSRSKCSIRLQCKICRRYNAKTQKEDARSLPARRRRETPEKTTRGKKRGCEISTAAGTGTAPAPLRTPWGAFLRLSPSKLWFCVSSAFVLEPHTPPDSQITTTARSESRLGATYVTFFCVHSRSLRTSRASSSPCANRARDLASRACAFACSSRSSRCLALRWPDLYFLVS